MSRTAVEQANHDLVMAMFRDVLQPMNSAAVDRYIAADYIQHSPLAAPGREALKQFLDHIKHETPEAVHDIKRSFVDGDFVIVHHNVRRFPGDPGFAVVDMFRIADGRIVEHWDVLQPVPVDGINPNSMF